MTGRRWQSVLRDICERFADVLQRFADRDLAALSESLAGRIDLVDLWPLSQGEIDRQPDGFVDWAFTAAETLIEHRGDHQLTDASASLASFVVAEIAKQLTWSQVTALVHHLRDRNGLEIDVVVEAADGRVVAVEGKPRRWFARAMRHRCHVSKINSIGLARTSWSVRCSTQEPDERNSATGWSRSPSPTSGADDVRAWIRVARRLTGTVAAPTGEEGSLSIQVEYK